MPVNDTLYRARRSLMLRAPGMFLHVGRRKRPADEGSIDPASAFTTCVDFASGVCEDIRID